LCERVMHYAHELDGSKLRTYSVLCVK